MSPRSHHVSGLDVLVGDPGRVRASRPGLLTHFAAVTDDLRRGVDALVDAGLRPHRLIAPEHGYWGTGQAGAGGDETLDEATGIPVVSAYLVDGEDLDRLLACTGIDALIVDLQDIGCRFYTYPWSMHDAMLSCARLGLPVIVLDRPGPLPTGPLGPGLDPALASFVGRIDVPLRHGVRMGDLARHIAAHHLPVPLDLTVIEAPADDGDAPWVAASPNMPTPTTAALYPGTGLLEGTTWCEGRGTTLPFELFGAPWATPAFAGRLRDLDLPGVRVREAVFRPTAGTFSGERVVGAQLHLRDSPLALTRGGTAAFDPLRITHAVLSTMKDQHPERELWRENTPGRPPFIDLLWGSTALREGIDDGAGYDEILAASPPPPRIPRASTAHAGVTP